MIEIRLEAKEDRKTRIFSLDNYGQKTRRLFFLFSPLRLRRNNFSCAIMRLTIEREKEDSDNAFSRFVFDRVIDIVAFGTKKRYTSMNRVTLTQRNTP